MAVLQVQSGVPARWRIVFLAVLPFLFFAAVLWFSRQEPAPVRDPASAAGQESLNARIRLETAAVAFSSGKLDPSVAVVTDRPDIYAPKQNLTELFNDEVPAAIANFEAPKYWGRMIGIGLEFDLSNPLPREFRPLSGLPVIADPRDRESWDVFLDGKLRPERFDMILLDCAFPARVTAPGIDLWTSQTFENIAQARANAGTVFAVVLPHDRPQAAACAMTAMKNVFGSVGTFRFGDRIVAASSVPMHAARLPETLKDFLRRPAPEDGEMPSPVFDLDEINDNAVIAGYYAEGEVPVDAISVVLQRDYSDAPPAWLLENIHRDRDRFGRNIGPLAYAEAELLPHLRKHLPGGLPYGRICAWALGAALLVYLILRYFISWKPVHKQAFLAFEDMFLFTGCLSLFSVALLNCLPSPRPVLFNWGSLAWLPFVGLLALISLKWPTRVKHRLTRVLYTLLGLACYALAFRLERVPDPLFGLLQYSSMACFLLPVGFLGDLVQTRIQEPVQPGPAIPLAFVLGVAASLAVFAASLFFPAGPMMFAAAICVFRLVFLDN